MFKNSKQDLKFTNRISLVLENFYFTLKQIKGQINKINEEQNKVGMRIK